MQITLCFYLFLYVLQQEGGGSQVVHWNVEEALNLFLMEVHGDQVGETCANMVSLSALTTAVLIVLFYRFTFAWNVKCPVNTILQYVLL